MSRMGEIEAMRIEWYAARMLPLKNAGRRTAIVNARHETYTDRAGRPRRRAVAGTGERMFVHELLLRRAGFEVFLPCRKEWRVTDRHRKRKTLVSYPLLTGWLFLGWPEGQPKWGKLSEMGIVQGLLGDAGRPGRIPEGVMQRMMRDWGAGRLAPEHHRYLRTHREFEVGDTVKVIDGPFEGFSFDVINISEAGVSGVLQIFGRDVPADFAAEQVEAIYTLHRYVDKKS